MKLFVLSFLTAVICVSARAEQPVSIDSTTEDERRYLIQISKELDHVRELARKAQAASDKRARVILDYGSLISDLTDMKQSIENHIEKPNRSPRLLKSIDADYERRTENQ